MCPDTAQQIERSAISNTFQLQTSPVEASRIGAANDNKPNPDGEFVLYWMIASRRVRWNFALQRAVDWAVKLNKPLVLLEPLQIQYPWASDRLHSFIIQGMQDNADRLSDTPILYYPYVEPHRQAARGLLPAIAARACLIVTDDFPCFIFPGVIEAVAPRVPVLLEKIDGNGLLPLSCADREFETAYSFRRFSQKQLPSALGRFPAPDPVTGRELKFARKDLLEDVREKWPPFDVKGEDLSGFEIDHRVRPSRVRGGSKAAERRLQEFLARGLPAYEESRHPDAEATSGLSPYLHFGHISSHQIFWELARQESWSPHRLSAQARGQRHGWWGMSTPAESFLDQLIIWRELGFHFVRHRPDHAEYSALPLWARRTLEEHRTDPRPYVYEPEEFESAQTHDPIWNAAQRQLLAEGAIHNYLRMLWGKKILHWSRSPREALSLMIHLNNKLALDGRDPNSYSGILWCLGRFDRPWGPEREVFGKVRYMTSANTKRKLRLDKYLARFGEGSLG